MSENEAMEVMLASPRGFCAGVERAIEIVERALELRGPPIYVRHEIVHNKYVVENLRAKGAVFDATCPLVTKVHVEVTKMLREGYEIVMIGHRGHPEAEGTMGQAGQGMHLVETGEDG